MKLLAQEVRDHGPLDLEESIAPDRMPVETPDHPSLVAPVRVSVHAEHIEGKHSQDDEILALIQAETRVAMECARCLERFEAPLKASMELHHPFSGGDVEVDEQVRQGLVLALPVKPLCRPACRGLCPRCGKNLNAGACGCTEENPTGPFTALKDLKLR